MNWADIVSDRISTKNITLLRCSDFVALKEGHCKIRMQQAMCQIRYLTVVNENVEVWKVGTSNDEISTVN